MYEALSALFRPYARSDGPGVVVGIAQHGELFYRKAFGMASLEHARALTTATRLRIGSVSKHFTCLAALLLCEEGLLDADAGIGTYIPELSRAGGAPTLRQLMSHRGGQRCALDLALLTQGLAIPPRGATLAAQIRQRDENFHPGERMMYSNGGYHLLSLAIERASGMPFDAFLDARIFTPMGMHETASIDNDMAVVPGIASFHVPDGEGGYLRGIFPSREILGEGGIVSTVDDMLRWTAHMHGEKIVGTDATWAQMLEMPVFSSGQGSNYALGLKQTIYRGVQLTHHSGGVIGGTSHMLFSATHGLDVVLLSNGAVDTPIDLAHRIVDIVLATVLSGDGPPIPARASAHAARLGCYRSLESNAVYALEDHDGALALGGWLCAGKPLPLYPIEGSPTNDVAIEAGSDGTFSVHWGMHNAPDDIDHLRIAHCGHAETFERVAEAPPMTAEIAAEMCGIYESHDANARAVIEHDPADHSTLILRMQGAAGGCDYRLTPIADHVFGMAPIAPLAFIDGIVTLSQDPSQQVTPGFRIDTQRSRRVTFMRAVGNRPRYPEPCL